MEIELPDGTILQAPDGSDPRVVTRNYLAKQNATPVGSALNTISQGATLGFSDEIASGVKATLVAPFSPDSWRDIYEDQLITERANLNASRSENPVISTVGEVAGGVTSGVGAARTAGKYISQQAISRIPALARLMGLGAAGGATYGAGSAEEGERMQGAAVGGATGAVAAPVGAGAVNVAGRIGRQLLPPLNRVLSNSPKTQAVRNVITALEADDLSPADALRRLDELGPDAVLADVGENIAATARGASGQQGRARSIASSFLRDRQQGQSQRLMQGAAEGVTDSAGAFDPNDFRKGFLSFMTRRQSDSAPLYEQAFSSPLQVTETLQALLERPAMKSAMRRGARYLQNEGGGAGHVRLLDYAKQALDDDIGTAIRAGNRNQARILTRLKRDFLDEIDTQLGNGNPENSVYRQAREMYAGEAQLRDAAEMGTSIFKRSTDLDATELALEAMTASEKDTFRAGVLRGLVDMIESSADNRNTAAQVIRSPRARQAVRLAFDSDEAFERFMRTAESESVFSQTRNTVLSGSRTAEFQQDIKDVSRGAGALRAATYSGSDPISSGVQMLQHLGFGDASQETLEEMSDLLFGRGRGLFVLRKAADRAARPQTPALERQARAVGGVIAGQNAITAE